MQFVITRTRAAIEEVCRKLTLFFNTNKWILYFIIAAPIATVLIFCPLILLIPIFITPFWLVWHYRKEFK